MNEKSGNLRQFFEGFAAADIMKQDPPVIREDEEFSEALILFKSHKTHHILIVDDQRRLVGMLSQKYMYRSQSPRKMLSNDVEYRSDIVIDGNCFYEKETLNSYILRNIMRRDPPTLSQQSSLQAVVDLMHERNTTCIPVIDEKRKILGMITNQELTAFLYKYLHA